MVTRKPPAGLAGAPYVTANKIDLAGLRPATKIFEGSAREGARGFPANVNVAAALSLAGIGPDRTTLEIWADPDATRNMHRIEVEADSASFRMQIANVPSENPKTGAYHRAVGDRVSAQDECRAEGGDVGPDRSIRRRSPRAAPRALRPDYFLK